MSSLSTTWLVAAARRRTRRGEPTVRPSAAAMLDATLVFRVGLAILFLVNALVAWVDPEQFRSLVVESRSDRLVDPDLVVWAIRANDLAVGLLLLVAVSRWPRFVPAWAGLYLLGVSAVKLAALA